MACSVPLFIPFKTEIKASLYERRKVCAERFEAIYLFIRFYADAFSINDGALITGLALTCTGHNMPFLTLFLQLRYKGVMTTVHNLPLPVLQQGGGEGSQGGASGR